MDHYLFFLSDSIYYGFCITTLVLLLAKKSKVVDLGILIQANQILLLVRTVFLIFGLIFQIFNGWYSGSEYQQYAITNGSFGPFWLAFWLPLIAFNILPLILLSKKRLKNLSSATFLLTIWLITILTNWFLNYYYSSVGWSIKYGINLTEIAAKTLFYLLPLSMVYFGLKRRSWRIKSVLDKSK